MGTGIAIEDEGGVAKLEGAKGDGVGATLWLTSF
jgi:hypothetical protein